MQQIIKNKGGNYDTDKKQRKISNFTGKSGENGRIGDERRIQFCRRSIRWKKSRASAVPERSPETVSYRAASGRRAHWRDQFCGNHRPDGRKVFVCLPDGRSFLLGSICGSSRRKRNLRCTDGKRRGRLLLPSPGVPGNAHHLTAPAV